MSLSAKLARKQVRETHYDLLVADPTAAEALVTAAEAELRLAKGRGEQAGVDTARTAVEAAREALKVCVERIVFRPLPPAEFEALIVDHPPSEQDQAKGAQWDRNTFGPALLAACTVDGDLDADGWAKELGSERWNTAERNAIFGAALDANLSSRSVAVPFG